jgi:ribosomal protein S18 acetylase RimI-like enzyme
MSAFIIRAGAIDDARVIAAFNAAMARETEALELDPDRLLAGVRAVFDDPAKGFYLVAEQDSEVIGQLMITYEWSDWRNGVFWWVQSVYVATAARGRGAYRQLYSELLRRAQEQGDVCGVRLYVEHNNDAAKRAYAKLGMSATVYEMWEEDFVLKRA